MATSRILPRDLSRLSNEQAAKRVLGAGARFPFQFSPKGDVRQVEVTAGVEKVHESIWTILSTRKGERVGRPTYGSDLPRLVFEPNDEVLWAQLELETAGALQLWEPRIRIVRVSAVSDAASLPVEELLLELRTKEYVEAFQSGHVIGIVIEYQVIRTAQPGIFVYPFVTQTAALSYGT